MLKDGSIEEFKANVSKGNGFARPNLFYVQFPVISGISSYTMGIMCEEVELPTRQISTVERTVGIVRQQVGYGYVNSNISLTFRVTNDHEQRRYFENWQRWILGEYEPDNEGHFGARYPDEYVKDITIYQLERGVSHPFFSKQFDKKIGPFKINLDIDLDIKKAGSPRYKWTLYRAFPVTVQASPLSDNSTGLSTVTVEFAYKSFKGVPIKSNKDSGFTFVGGVNLDF